MISSLVTRTRIVFDRLSSFGNLGRPGFRLLFFSVVIKDYSLYRCIIKTGDFELMMPASFRRGAKSHNYNT
jgi:hypothetical protein